MCAGFSLCLAVALCASALQGQESEGTAIVHGAIIGASGPATVLLRSGDRDPTRYYDGYRTVAAADGSFTFRYVRPGTYRVEAEAAGLLPVPLEPVTIELRSGETRNGIRIAMAPRTHLCGHVTENGAPKRTGVNAWRLDPEFGTFSRTFLPAADEGGGYDFGDLTPGTYCSVS